MDTLTAGYQFSADAFRRFIIRTLTDDIPPDGDEKEIARFILRHPAFNGGWLLFLAAEIHERSRTHNSITVTVSVDNCVFRSIRSRIGIEVRSAIRIHSINR
ncbi:hypothetical protein ACM2MK_23160, partial [Escherichia coli]